MGQRRRGRSRRRARRTAGTAAAGMHEGLSPSFPIAPRRQRCVPSSSRRPPGALLGRPGWSNGRWRDRAPSHRPADRRPGRGGARRPARRAARRPADRRHPHHRPGRLALDPLGAARRRPDAAAHPAARARRRPPRRRHAHARGSPTTSPPSPSGSRPPARRHRSPAGRRPRRPWPGSCPTSRPTAWPPSAAPPRWSRRPGPTEPHWWLAHLGVRPTSRRRGLAAAVLAPVLRALRRRGHARRGRRLQLGERPVPARLRLRGHRRAADDGRRAPALGAGAAASAPLRFLPRTCRSGARPFVQGVSGRQEPAPTRGGRDGPVPADRDGADRRSGSRARVPGRDHEGRRRGRPGDAATPASWVFAGGLHDPSTRHGAPARTTATCSSPTARTSRARSTSAASRSSTSPTWTPRSSGDASSPAPPRLPIEVRPFRLTGPGRRGDPVFREHYGRAVAVLVRLLGDIDAAEEAVQDAFVTAVARWPVDGVPPSPAGWIITTARNRAIDRLRREGSRADRHAQAALLHGRRPNRWRRDPCPTTGCAWSSPAATRRSPSRRRWR